MANQPEISTYEPGIYQWEETDPVEGGVGGIDNLPILQLSNRTKWLKDQITAMLKLLPRFRGYVTGIDIGDGSPGDPFTVGGQVVSATLQSTESGSGGVGASSTILVTFPSMGNTNYFVRISPESRNNPANENDSLAPVFKVISSTQIQLSVQQAFGTVQNLRLHLEFISLDA